MSNNIVTPTTYSDEESLVSNSAVTIQGGSGVLPRYYNCTVTAMNSNIMVNGTQNSNFNVMGGITTINGAQYSNFMISGSPTTVSGGNNNNFNADGSLLFSQGTGFNSIVNTGQTFIFGTDGLNLVLRSYNSDALFVAGEGNETLNAAGSTSPITVYASQTSNHNTNLVVTTGSGNDELDAGTGNSTLNGGAGNNIFVFNKDTDAGGRTVIGDFAVSAGNKISLYNYNLTQDSLGALLASSHNDSNGNAVLNLDNHQITVQGVSINNLHTEQFNI